MKTVIDDSEFGNISTTCTPCSNLIDATKRRCKAFEKIPNEIWKGENTHRRPVEGDGGIVFVVRQELLD